MPALTVIAYRNKFYFSGEKNNGEKSYILSYFLQTLYGMADLFIIGQFYGVDSITAVSNGSQNRRSASGCGRITFFGAHLLVCLFLDEEAGTSGDRIIGYDKKMT